MPRESLRYNLSFRRFVGLVLEDGACADNPPAGEGRNADTHWNDERRHDDAHESE